jgi:Fe2+ or Zn2+ uptake regulation protein
MELIPDFQTILRSNGFKATPGRIHLLGALWNSTGPLTVDALGKSLNLNVVTLYRALNHLADKGLLLRGNGAGDVTHFSYPKGMHHHHMVCMDCGFIKGCVNCS